MGMGSLADSATEGAISRIRPGRRDSTIKAWGRLGFDPKVLRQLIRIRKQEAAEVEEQETMLDVYRRALGM